MKIHASERTRVIFYLIGMIIALSAIGISIFISPWFSWTDNALSDLGNSNNGFIVSLLFNIGVFIGGLFVLLFSINLYKIMENTISKLGGIVFIISTFAILGTAIFPVTVEIIHITFSRFLFIALTFSMFLTGLGWYYHKENRPLGKISLILSMIPTVIWFMPYTNIAIPEAFIAISVGIWVGSIYKLLYKEKIDQKS